MPRNSGDDSPQEPHKNQRAEKNEIGEEIGDDDEAFVAFNARLVRVVRTSSSESFVIWQDDTRLGQVDIHYGWDIIHATLILEKDLTEDEQAGLVDLIDEDAVSSHLPKFSREDFLVTVFRAEEMEPFSDGPDPEETDEDDDY